MTTQSFDTIRNTLHRRGLPPHYIRRVVEELEDHRLDIAGELAVTDQTDTSDLERLGDLDTLAESFVDRYHNQTFAGRHPFVTFVLAPIPVVLAAWATLLLVLLGVIKLYELGFGEAGKTIAEMSPAVVGMALAMYVAEIVVPPAAVALFFAWLAYRGGKGMIWASAATLLVAFAALCFHSGLQFPIEPGKGSYSVGLGFSPRLLLGPQLLQMLVPIFAAAFVMIGWQRQRRALTST